MKTGGPTERFRALHERGCFLMPNVWSAGTARLMESMGAPAVASSSAALAFDHALPDHPDALDADLVLRNLESIVGACDLPVNADFQSGYGRTPEEVGRQVRRCVETGVAGLSIEDATGDASRPLFDVDESVERLQAARESITGSGVVLTARCEAFLVGVEDPLRVATERLDVYRDVGPDCLFAPDCSTVEEVRAIVETSGEIPVNILLADPIWMSVESLGSMGVRRISVGSALARTGWGAVVEAMHRLCAGHADPFEGAASFGDLNGLFGS